MRALLPALSDLRAVWIAVALALIAGLAGAFTMPVLDRDEGRYAQATAQMLETGDFVRIRYMDAPRNKKPAGIHWLQAASVSLVSDVEARRIWAWRLPSVLGAMLAAFACFLAGRSLFRRAPDMAPAAAIGACLLAVCLLMGTEAGIAKTDAALAGAATLMMAMLARIRSGGSGRRTAVAFWAFMAVGVLIKGPIAPLLAGLTLLTLFAWERRAAWARPLLFWPGPLLFLAATVPWFVAVELAGAGFLREAVGVDLAPKMIGAAEGHWGPPGYHTLALILQFWPGTLFLVPGLILCWRARRPAREDGDAATTQAADGLRFLIAWALPFLLLYEVLPTKLSHYGLPAYPAFALIAGAGAAALLRGMRMRRAQVASLILFGFGALVWCGLIVTLAFVYGDGFARVAALVFAPLVLAAAIAAMATMRRPAGLVLAMVAALAFHIAGRGLVAPHLAPFTLSQRIAALVPQDARPLATSESREPSLVFLMGGAIGFVTPEEMVEAAAQGRFGAYASPRPIAAQVEAAIVRAAGCARTLGATAGINYSNGDEVDVIVLAPGRDCAGGP